MRTLTIQNHSSFDWNILIYASIGMIFSISGSLQLLIALFPFIYIRSYKVKAVFFLSLIPLFFVSPNLFYQFFIFVVGYHLFGYFTLLCKGNIMKSEQFYVGLSAFSLSLIQTSDIRTAVSFLVIQMIFYHENLKSFEWLKKEFNLSQSLYAIITVGVISILGKFMPQYAYLFANLGLIFICFGCSPLLSIASFFLINLMSTGLISFESFVFIYLLSLLRDHLGLMILVYFGLFISSLNDLNQILIMGLYLVFFLLLSKEGIPLQNEQIKESNAKAFLHKQLLNFSLIFDHLGTYYENVSQIESSFLKSMSKALDYTSKKCISDDASTDSLKNQIIYIFEGYEISYEEISVEENEEGFIRLNCALLHFHENDVKEVLLPLLDHILPTPMECVGIQNSLTHLGILHVELISKPPVQIDAYADSAHNNRTCGDSFSIFNHSRSVYCMISDGMGVGVEASKISKCIIHLFQRMIFSNIQEIEAMNCINKLLQSDAYATCDVLAFDRYRKSVIICKSAANPTYLIRNGELFAIWGNSLPIGIVAHIEVDHIHVEVEKGDWFVMSSDGVHVEEILKWMKESENLCARKEVERFMKMMKEVERSDDSTILLAKVK